VKYSNIQVRKERKKKEMETTTRSLLFHAHGVANMSINEASQIQGRGALRATNTEWCFAACDSFVCKQSVRCWTIVCIRRKRLEYSSTITH
jgi:hypothetical protein